MKEENDYIAIEAQSSDRLQKLVVEAMALGYKCVGGVSVTCLGAEFIDDFNYAQAMIKVNENER